MFVHLSLLGPFSNKQGMRGLFLYIFYFSIFFFNCKNCYLFAEDDLVKSLALLALIDTMVFSSEEARKEVSETLTIVHE